MSPARERLPLFKQDSPQGIQIALSPKALYAHESVEKGAINGYADADSSILYQPQHRHEFFQVFWGQFPLL